MLSLLGLMVLVVTLAPTQTAVQSGAESTPTPNAPNADLTDPDAFDVTETLSAAPGVQVRTVEAELGDRVEIVVEGERPDSVSWASSRRTWWRPAIRPVSKCSRKRQVPTH